VSSFQSPFYFVPPSILSEERERRENLKQRQKAVGQRRELECFKNTEKRNKK
jgi:hypothetical protein